MGIEVLEDKSATVDKMNYHFEIVDFAWDIIVFKTSFEVIIAQRFQLISDSENSKQLIGFFDAYYELHMASIVRLTNQFWPSASLALFYKFLRDVTCRGLRPSL